MKYLITGGAGFMGSGFIRYILKMEEDSIVINLDKLTYAGNLENLKSVENMDRYTFVKGDISDSVVVRKVISGGVDVVVNFAAESHVDRSILEPDLTLRTNILGTITLLDGAREFKVPRFIQISTDEVYGSLGREGSFTEELPLKPNSPYSASKAGADLLVLAYFKTYNMPVIITRSSNNYGPYQFPEKLIPLFVSNALEDKPLPLYGDGSNVRDWIYVDDHSSAVYLTVHKGKAGEVYNIGANNERTNRKITEIILEKLGKPSSLVKYVEDRPGHDFRYSMDSSKIRKELGFKPSISFEEGLDRTLEWYINNRDWWKRVKSGEYQKYFEKWYGDRLRGGGGN